MAHSELCQTYKKERFAKIVNVHYFFKKLNRILYIPNLFASNFFIDKNLRSYFHCTKKDLGFRISSVNVTKKFLMEKFIFCAVYTPCFDFVFTYQTYWVTLEISSVVERLFRYYHSIYRRWKTIFIITNFIFIIVFIIKNKISFPPSCTWRKCFIIENIGNIFLQVIYWISPQLGSLTATYLRALLK